MPGKCEEIEFVMKLPCSLSFDIGIGLGTGSDVLKLDKLFPDFTRAVEARLAEDALSVLRVVVALLIFLLLSLLLREPSRLKTLLFCSLPDVEDTEPTLVLVEILLMLSMLSEFLALTLLLSGSQTDLDLIEPKFSRRLKAVGIRRTGFLLLSSSLSLDEGSELNEESTNGSTLDMLSHRFKIGSLLSASFTFSKEEIIGKSIGGNLISLLVEVE